jgi:hypothetical protein
MNSISWVGDLLATQIRHGQVNPRFFPKRDVLDWNSYAQAYRRRLARRGWHGPRSGLSIHANTPDSDDDENCHKESGNPKPGHNTSSFIIPSCNVEKNASEPDFMRFYSMSFPARCLLFVVELRNHFVHVIPLQPAASVLSDNFADTQSAARRD